VWDAEVKSEASGKTIALFRCTQILLSKPSSVQAFVIRPVIFCSRRRVISKTGLQIAFSLASPFLVALAREGTLATLGCCRMAPQAGVGVA